MFGRIVVASRNARTKRGRKARPASRAMSMRQRAEERGWLRLARKHADHLARANASDLMREMPDPLATVSRGVAGLAWFLTEAARIFDRARYLDAARALIEVARNLAVDPQVAFGKRAYDRDYGIFGGLYTGAAGLSWVEALIADVADDRDARNRALREWRRQWSRTRRRGHLSMLSGAAGFAEASADALEQFGQLDAQERALLADMGQQAVEALLRGAARPMMETPGVRPRALAFGRAGELYALLRWVPRDPATLGELGALSAFHAAHPIAPNDPLAASWCNGVTGLVRLWLRAHKCLRDADSGDRASALLEELMGLAPGAPGLCCGIIGQALILHDFGRAAGSPKLDGAVRTLTRAAVARASGPSLMLGKTGVAFAALAMARADVRRPPGMS